MLKRVSELVSKQQSFGLETTLSGKVYKPLIR